MHVSDSGRALIEKFEGLRLQSYRDVVGVWTIGYGHTGPDIGPGIVWTKQQADDALSQRLANEFEPGVLNAIKSPPTPVTQGQFDAMVSLAYNIGVRGFANSSVARHHIAGEYDAAADSFSLWNKAGGRVLQALVNRRDEEAQVYADASVEPAPTPVPAPPLMESPEMSRLNDIWNLLHRFFGGPIVSVKFAVPQFYSKEGKVMATSLTLPDDQKANVPLIFKDATGVVHAPPTGGSATSDNTAVATVTVAADDASVDIVSVGDGTCNVTYTNGAVSDTIVVTVAPPTPTSVAMDSEHATFSAKI